MRNIIMSDRIRLFIIGALIITANLVVFLIFGFLFNYNYPKDIIKDLAKILFLGYIIITVFNLIVALLFEKLFPYFLGGLLAVLIFISPLLTTPLSYYKDFAPSSKFINALKESKEIIYKDKVYRNFKILKEPILFGLISIPKWVVINNSTNVIPLKDVVALYPQGKEPDKDLIKNIEKGKPIFCKSQKTDFNPVGKTLREGIFVAKYEDKWKGIYFEEKNNIYAIKNNKVVFDFKNCWIVKQEFNPPKNIWGYECQNNFIPKNQIKEAIVKNPALGEEKAIIVNDKQLYFENDCSIIF